MGTRAGVLTFLYTLVPSFFGDLAVVWQDTGHGPQVYRVFLPSEGTSALDFARQAFPKVVSRSCSAIDELGERIECFLQGQAVEFDLAIIALSRCPDFQRRVLLAEWRIPRGWVSTYGRIANHLGVPRGARAVGNALSHNPFPVIIPCHRAIRSDGSLGGFQGGIRMKRVLLELEGIEITPAGRVRMERVYYSKASSF